MTPLCVLAEERAYESALVFAQLVLLLVPHTDPCDPKFLCVSIRPLKPRIPPDRASEPPLEVQTYPSLLLPT